MKINFYQPINKADPLLPSNTKTSVNLIEQFQENSHKALQFKINKSTQTISFDSPLNQEDEGMLALTNLEKQTSVFHITKKKKKNNKFKNFNQEQELLYWGEKVFYHEN